MTDHACKVCRVLSKRGIETYESAMVEEWKGERGARKGYRKLADWFNTLILRREMDKAGISTLGNEPESKYERLQSNEPVAEEVRMILRREGVPINEIEADFVSYGVIRTHLKECLGEKFEQESSDWERDAIERTRSHAERKLSDAVQAAVSNGKLDSVGDVSVIVSVEVECEETHVRVPLNRALRRGYVSTPEAEADQSEQQNRSPQPAGMGPNTTNSGDSS